MNNLTIQGKTTVCGIGIPKIAGGFGGNKPAMLAKTIAELHEMDLRHVNEAINNNRSRFRNGIDIIDIKGTNFAVDLVDSEILTQNAINASNNVYILSRIGYSKLLKIFNDDLAWNKYEAIMDEYFELKEINGLKQKKVATRIKPAVRDALETAELITTRLKVDLGIAQAAAITMVEINTGVQLDQLKKLLPATEHEIGYLNATEIGNRLGFNARKTNQVLMAKGLQTQDIDSKGEKRWRLTDMGKTYGEEYPFSRNGHSDYQIRWNESVISVLGSD